MLADQWLYIRNGKRVGPLELGDLIEKLLSSDLPEETLVWRHGMERWTPAKGVPEITDKLPPPLPPEAAASISGSVAADKHWFYRLATRASYRTRTREVGPVTLPNPRSVIVWTLVALPLTLILVAAFVPGELQRTTVRWLLGLSVGLVYVSYSMWARVNWRRDRVKTVQVGLVLLTPLMIVAVITEAGRYVIVGLIAATTAGPLVAELAARAGQPRGE